MNPSYAVINRDADNAYGHLLIESLNLMTNDVMVYRTDEERTIIASTDGKSIPFNIPPSESWKAGEQTGSDTSSVTDKPTFV